MDQKMNFDMQNMAPHFIDSKSQKIKNLRWKNEVPHFACQNSFFGPYWSNHMFKPIGYCIRPNACKFNHQSRNLLHNFGCQVEHSWELLGAKISWRLDHWFRNYVQKTCFWPLSIMRWPSWPRWLGYWLGVHFTYMQHGVLWVLTIRSTRKKLQGGVR